VPQSSLISPYVSDFVFIIYRDVLAAEALAAKFSATATAGRSRTAFVTVGKQRRTVMQGLSEMMQGVSLDIMKAHQDKNSRCEDSAKASSWFLVLATVCCLQWLGKLNRVVGRRGLPTRFDIGQRPFSIARPFHTLTIVLGLVATTIVLLPPVHAASANLIEKRTAFNVANTARTALLSSIQEEKTATAARTLVHSHLYLYVYLYFT